MTNQSQIELWENNIEKSMRKLCDSDAIWTVDHAFFEKDFLGFVEGFFSITNGWLQFPSGELEL